MYPQPAILSNNQQPQTHFRTSGHRYVTPFIKSELYVMQNLYDSWQINNILKIGCSGCVRPCHEQYTCECFHRFHMHLIWQLCVRVWVLWIFVLLLVPRCVQPFMKTRMWIFVQVHNIFFIIFSCSFVPESESYESMFYLQVQSTNVFVYTSRNDSSRTVRRRHACSVATRHFEP